MRTARATAARWVDHHRPGRLREGARAHSAGREAARERPATCWVRRHQVVAGQGWVPELGGQD
eukprot:12537309-Alexandrium_andersonii.AAC.1